MTLMTHLFSLLMKETVAPHNVWHFDTNFSGNICVTNVVFRKNIKSPLVTLCIAQCDGLLCKPLPALILTLFWPRQLRYRKWPELKSVKILKKNNVFSHNFCYVRRNYDLFSMKRTEIKFMKFCYQIMYSFDWRIRSYEHFSLVELRHTVHCTAAKPAKLV